MDTQNAKRAYRRYAPIYDTLFGRLLQPGRRRIIEALNCRPGEQVLEVGVGTGLSLPLYPEAVQVTGIDLSPEMLERARARVGRLGLDNVAALEEMDATNMRFADASFDKVVVMYVVSVVDDAGRLMDEIRRVCKPGAGIFIVNHFHSESGIARRVEDALSPLSKALGFHTDLELQGFLNETGLEAQSITPVNLFGYWKLVECRVE